MKKILLLFLLLPLFIFSQNEKQQKMDVRRGSATPQTTPSSTPPPQSRQTPNVERNSKVEYRNESRQQRPSYSPSNQYRPTPRYRPNRNMMGQYYLYSNRYRGRYYGVPSYYYDYYYYDRFGVFQPSIIYVYPDNYYDTVVVSDVKHKIKKYPNLKQHRVGVGFTTDNELNVWFTTGKEKYFIVEYDRRLQRNNSSYYGDLTMDRVIDWDDHRVNDIIKSSTLFVGIGTKKKNLNVNLMVGFGKEKIYYQYFDEYYILSNNGYYSFNNYSNNFMTLKAGILYDYNNISFKGDYDPFRHNLNIGVGILF